MKHKNKNKRGELREVLIGTVAILSGLLLLALLHWFAEVFVV